MVISDWDATDATEESYEMAGGRGGELLSRFHNVANQPTKAAFGEFDELPAPVDSHPDEESKHPIGWWMALHIATVHQGYSLAEAADAFLYGLQHACGDVDSFESTDAAIQRIDDCVHSLGTLRTEIER